MTNRFIVGHLDSLANYFKNRTYNFFHHNNEFHVDYPRLKQGRVSLGVFAICPPMLKKQTGSFTDIFHFLEKVYYLVTRHSSLVLVRNYQDIEFVLQADKIGIILALEGADIIDDIKRLKMLYKLGIRMISLTWNNSNLLANGIGGEKLHSGLSQLGKKVVEEMENLGIIPDISHLARESFKELMMICKGPVVASHSNFYSLCKHRRNLTRQQIKKIVNCNGLIGISFHPPHLTENGVAKKENLLAQINYICQNWDIQNIALGTDFDGINNTVKGLEDISKLPKIREWLLDMKYSKREINLICWQNWLRIFEKVFRR